MAEQHNLMLEEIHGYKRTMRLVINSLGLLSSLYYLPIQFTAGLYIMGTLSLISAVYFAAIIFFLYKHNRHLWDGWGFVLVGPGVLLYALSVNPGFGVLWIYVNIIALFLMLSSKGASITAVIYIVATAFFTVPHFTSDILLRIYPTLILVSIFSFCFAYLIDRLLNTLNTTATRDPLTKALNRQTFHKSIEEALADHRRNNVVGVLFLFDLDHFKKVNDQHGHIAGDHVLQEIAKIVSTRIRETDQFFRYGGEEFAILLRHTPLQSAAVLADDIRGLVEAHTFTDGLKITISGGISEVDGAINVYDWIERSDTALYEAKHSGRNNIKIHVPPLKEWEEEKPAMQAVI